MPDAAAPLLSVADLACAYAIAPAGLSRFWPGRRQAVRAVDGVSFSIARGETLGIVGESGCGKSTLARLVVGLQQPTLGGVTFDGAPVRRPEAMPPSIRHRIQMIFQDPHASLNPRWRVAAIVGEPLRRQRRLPDTQRRARVAELLRTVGLDAADARRYPHEFSGGQRQRIAIARSLAAEPDFLVCDEPTSALDVSVQAQVLNLLRDLQLRLHLTCLFISHNLAVVHHMADRLGVMYLGRLVEIGPAAELFARPLHPYTRMLLAASPDPEPDAQPVEAIIGEPPSPLAPPPGCSFHPRCPLALPRCSVEAPQPRPAGAGVLVACHAVAAAG